MRRALGRLGFASGVLLAVALAGCLGPAPVQDDGPPYVVTVETRYVPDGAPNVSGPEGGGVNRLDPAKLPNGTVASYPMWVGVAVGRADSVWSGWPVEDVRTGWVYDDAPCRYWRPHSSRRAKDNLCDGASMRSRHVLPSLYPQDRAENYSWDVRMGWHGRGYVYSTANDSDESKPWNYTKRYSGSFPLGMEGSVRLVFNHRLPLKFSLSGPRGEIPEWMDEEVIEPKNCTSDEEEPYDYVFATDGHVANVHGEAERIAFDKWGARLELHGDARVVMEWSVLCRRNKLHVQI